MSHESGTSLELFGARSGLSISDAASGAGSGGLPSSMTANASGMPPEWGPFALDAVFASRKAMRKALEKEESSALIRALWTFANARHAALVAMKSAQDAAAALRGHRSLDDPLARAERLLDAYGIEPADVPPARAFDARLDLRPLAGETPFPLPRDSEPSGEAD